MKIKNLLSINTLILSVLFFACSHEHSVPTVKKSKATILPKYHEFAAQHKLRTQVPTVIFTISGNDCSACVDLAEQCYRRLLSHQVGVQTVAFIKGRSELVSSFQEKGYLIPIIHDEDFLTCKKLGITTFPSVTIVGSKGDIKSVYGIDDLRLPQTDSLLQIALDSAIIESAILFPLLPEKATALQTSKENYIGSIQWENKLAFNSLKNTFFVPDDSRNKIYEVDFQGNFITTIDLDTINNIKIDRPVMTLYNNDTLSALVRLNTTDPLVINSVLDNKEHSHGKEGGNIGSLVSKVLNLGLPMPYVIKVHKNHIDTMRAFSLEKRADIHTISYNSSVGEYIGAMKYVDYGNKDITPLSSFPSLMRINTLGRNINNQYFRQFDSSYLFKAVPYFETPPLTYYSENPGILTVMDRCSNSIEKFDSQYNLLSRTKIYPPAELLKWQNVQKKNRRKMMKTEEEGITDEFYKFFTPISLTTANNGSTLIVYKKMVGDVACIVQVYDRYGNLINQKPISVDSEIYLINYDGGNYVWFLNLKNNTIEKYDLSKI